MIRVCIKSKENITTVGMRRGKYFAFAIQNDSAGLPVKAIRRCIFLIWKQILKSKIK